MSVVISMLRGVNVGGRNRLKMDALRALYTALGFRDAQTFIQSGNVVFRTTSKDSDALCRRIQGGIERSFGFRPEVVVRSVDQMRKVLARNPMAGRRDFDPSKLLVTFLAGTPDPDARSRILGLELERQPSPCHDLAEELLGISDVVEPEADPCVLRIEDAGVDPRRVCIGHLGNLNDPNLYVHKTICRRGGFVGFDRQGGNGDANVVPLVIGLLDAGFADNVLISGDASRGYARPVTSFLPKLKAAGADDATLKKIMVDNSRRFLAFVPKRARPNA